MKLPDGRKAKLLIIAVALFLTGVYVITMMMTTGGRPISPLDDAYIHFQYARQIALGEPWRYNSGEPISTGATSFLYPFLLAVGYVAGFQSDRIVWLALLIGGLSLIGSALLIYRITLALLKSMALTGARLLQITSTSAALLFLFSGAIQWTFLNGMESGIFTLFVLAALDAALNKRLWRMALFLVISSLLRPEGLFLAGIAWVVLVSLQLLKDRRQLGQVFWPMTIAVLFSATPYFVNLALTGTPVATGAQAKSWFGNVPFRLTDIIGSMALMARAIVLRMSAGLLAPKPLPVAPLLLPMALLGAVAVWRRGDRPTVLLLAGWLLVGVIATATLITALWQVGRYQVPFLALILPFTIIGAFTLLSWIREPLRCPVTAVSLILVLVLSLFSTYQAQQKYHFAVDSIQMQQIAMGEWIRQHLPDDARIAVHDAGVIRYLGDRSVQDLIGLTVQGATAAWRHGSGAQFELMERLDQRPDYFATYPDVLSLSYFAETDLFAEKLFETELYPHSAAGAAGPLQVIYKADWLLANSGDMPHQPNLLQLTAGLPLVASIDVSDLEDERIKGLTWSEGVVMPGFPTEVRQYRYRADTQTEVIDGGRMITGEIEFPVEAQPDEPLILATRLHPESAGAVRVWVNEQDAGLWQYPAAPGEWIEAAFVVPANLVRQDRPVITLQVQEDERLEHAYPLFYIWVWQGGPRGTVVAPQNDESFEFGDGLTLLGYDLDLTTAKAGQAIPLTLYWKTDIPQSTDAKLFVHLYDADGDLVAQLDQRPYHDTQPPYAWIPGIPIIDPVQFSLPADLAPDKYIMAIGLYHPLSGERYPVSGNPDRLLLDERILLGEFMFP